MSIIISKNGFPLIASPLILWLRWTQPEEPEPCLLVAQSRGGHTKPTRKPEKSQKMCTQKYLTWSDRFHKRRSKIERTLKRPRQVFCNLDHSLILWFSDELQGNQCTTGPPEIVALSFLITTTNFPSEISFRSSAACRHTPCKLHFCQVRFKPFFAYNS